MFRSGIQKLKLIVIVSSKGICLLMCEIIHRCVSAQLFYVVYFILCCFLCCYCFHYTSHVTYFTPATNEVRTWSIKGLLTCLIKVSEQFKGDKHDLENWSHYQDHIQYNNNQGKWWVRTGSTKFTNVNQR